MLRHRQRHHERLPRGGHDQALTWAEVAEQHGAFLEAVAYRLTGNPDDAQDLVQEVLLRVRRGLATYRPTESRCGSMEGWLSRIATNAFLDDRRRRRRRPLDVVGDLPEPSAADGSVIAADAHEALGHDTLPDHLQDALRGLSREQRAVIVLSDVVGLDYAEIAEALCVPVGTVRSRIHRGRAQLRTALRDSVHA